MADYIKEVTFPDRDGRGHAIRLLRDRSGTIYAEIEAKHNGHRVFSTIRLGEAWELLPRLASLG